MLLCVYLKETLFRSPYISAKQSKRFLSFLPIVIILLYINHNKAGCEREIKSYWELKTGSAAEVSFGPHVTKTAFFLSICAKKPLYILSPSTPERNTFKKKNGKSQFRLLFFFYQTILKSNFSE